MIDEDSSSDLVHRMSSHLQEEKLHKLLIFNAVVCSIVKCSVQALMLMHSLGLPRLNMHKMLLFYFVMFSFSRDKCCLQYMRNLLTFRFRQTCTNSRNKKIN